MHGHTPARPTLSSHSRPARAMGRWTWGAWMAGVVTLLQAGCASQSAQKPDAPLPPAAEAQLFSTAPTARTLTLLHTSDFESEILPLSTDPTAGGVARFAAVKNHLARKAKNPLFVLAGDSWIPSPLLSLDIGGQNAISRGNNVVAPNAAAVGNHEFDLGDSHFAGMLKHATYPYLSATIDITGGPLDAIDVEADTLKQGTPWTHMVSGLITPRAKACVGLPKDAPHPTAPGDDCVGLTVGLVGATTEELHAITSASDGVVVAGTLEAVRDAVQTHVNALTAEGVDIVVLVSHLQDVRKEMALLDLGLTGVDIIVAGGGDNRLANANTRLHGEDTPDAVCAEHPNHCYPLVRTAKDERPTLIVATDGQFRYVGNLSVAFDKDGVLTGFDRDASKPWPVDETTMRTAGIHGADDAVAFEDNVRAALAPLSTPIAHSRVFLNGIREDVRNRETNLGDLSADAMLFAAQSTQAGKGAVLALRNAGGIRNPIGTVTTDTYERRGAPITPLALKSALRFDNDIVVVDTTHAQLRATFEAALRGVGSGRGHFPQVSAGVELVYDAAGTEQAPAVVDGKVTGVKTPGARVRQLSVKAPDGSTVRIVKDGMVPTPDAAIRVATLSFLAGGGDGYFPGRRPAATALGEKGAFTEQSVVVQLIRAQDAEGQWNGGRAYVDPVSPEAATRIHPVRTAAARPATP